MIYSAAWLKQTLSSAMALTCDSSPVMAWSRTWRLVRLLCLRYVAQIDWSALPHFNCLANLRLSWRTQASPMNLVAMCSACKRRPILRACVCWSADNLSLAKSCSLDCHLAAPRLLLRCTAAGCATMTSRANQLHCILRLLASPR